MDPSGSAIAGANVTATNDGTKVSQSVMTDENGYYQVLGLPIGTYSVTAEASGFRKQVFEHQALQINQSLRLDAKLVIGQTTDTVEVTTQAANVETVNQTIGASVTGETIQRAPLNGRNVLDLAALQPGVTETNGDSSAAGKYSIAGGRSDSVTYLFDGAINNDLLSNGVVFNPNPDTIAEFRILESNYSAEYGRNGGGIISVVTKSGTNEWHGSAFEFVRNDAFNANLFFNKVTDTPTNRPVLKRNQYGGTFGGPIRKDKIFFFVGYQGQRLSAAQTSQQSPVFTPAELTGDFSGDPGVSAFLLANPYFQSNAALAAQGVIDPTKINPVAQKYIAAGLIPTDPTGTAFYQGSQIDNNNEITGKVDYLISDKNKISISLGGFRNPVLNPFVYSTGPGFPNTGFTHNYILNGTYYHTFNPNVVNEFRGFTQRSNTSQDAIGRKLPSAADLGIGITPDNPTGPPNLNFNNGSAEYGFSVQGPTSLIDNTFGFLDTVSWVRGRHNMKFGGGLTGYQNNTIYDYYVNGEFDFYTYSYGSGPASGNPFADFLLGAPSQLFQNAQAPSTIRSKAMNAFAQDEWRIRRNLTLTFGIRYEYSQPKFDTKGRSFSIIPGQRSTVFTGAPVGMVFPGDAGAPTGTNFPDKNDWAPRIGFAWDPKGDGKTSLRGGFGVFYDVLKGEDSLQFNGQPPFFASAAPAFPNVGPGQSTDIPFFSDPFGPNSANVPNPFPSTPPPSNLNFLSAGLLPINSSFAIYVVNPHLRTPYTYQYNLSLQREIAPNTVVEVSYVGSSSHGLTGLQDINPFILGTTDRKLNLTQGNVTCYDSSGISTSLDPSDPNLLNNVCSFAGLPEFRNVTKASYNSLQASMTRQIAQTG